MVCNTSFTLYSVCVELGLINYSSGIFTLLVFTYSTYCSLLITHVLVEHTLILKKA